MFNTLIERYALLFCGKNELTDYAYDAENKLHVDKLTKFLIGKIGLNQKEVEAIADVTTNYELH